VLANSSEQVEQDDCVNPGKTIWVLCARSYSVLEALVSQS
jgi:hypothetical protein